jgi:hypothetical protein
MQNVHGRYLSSGQPEFDTWIERQMLLFAFT